MEKARALEKKVGANALRAMALLAAVSVSSCTLTSNINIGNTNVTCTSPYENDGQLVYPCGRCMACRIQRTQQWSLRLMHENSYHQDSCFVTLTYDDEHLPKDNRVTKVTLQNFIKRLRFNSGLKIKYYGCGEYGDRNGRSHYHLIIFGMGVQHQKIIEDSWKYGHVYIGTVTMDSCKYVAAYIQKKLYKGEGTDPKDPRRDLFSIMSQGLGLKWAQENKIQLQNIQKITYQGTPLGVPRYYVNKLDLDLSETLGNNVKKTDENWERLLESEAIDTSDLAEIVLQRKNQRRKNLEAKAELKQRKL